MMSYARLGALAVGPIVMILVLFFLLGRGRGQKKVAVQLAPAAAPAPAVEAPAAPPVPTLPGRKPGAPVAQPISEDPQKVYIREQIQVLGKSNPATVAQLIQTWMDEDRRN
jgi:flagellar biosynthesis/type III secretory pathway M-ring protein FliF/YscJ